MQKLLSKLGPGLITGAADDDPSGIATYSQAGAQFGFSMLWTMIFTYPLMVGIQTISARMGRVTGHGLADNIARHFGKPLAIAIVALLFIANLINIGADIAAMGQALKLVVGGPEHGHALVFGALCLFLQIRLPYQTYVRYLKWLTLALLAYVALIFTIHVPWREVALRTVLPRLSVNKDFLMTVVAVFGTTISPYLFFWQATQEVVDMQAARELPLNDPDDPHITDGYMQLSAHRHLQRIKLDTWVGMGFSNLVAFFIILSTAATLHAHGITDIETSAQAAEALRPLAGNFAFLLFALGIIGTGMLAVPVLAGSTAYAVTEIFGWKSGLDRKFLDARRFYAIVGVATLGGVLLDFTKIDPIKALFWSAVINGVIAVPIMAVMMLLAVRPEVMGSFTVKPRLKIMGWIATVIMAIAVVAMLVTL
jgi:NRAMP (natural resistance-associated macrophage protein)-like metal ion transporter